MSTTQDNLPALEIDVAQWRRDIQTFVETTEQELSAINDQLAADFSRAGNTRATIARRPAVQSKSTLMSNSAIAKSNCETTSRTDERLLQLKQKLAAKLAGEDDSN